MKRSDLEHLIRRGGRIAGEREIVVIGSQAVLASFPTPPTTLLRSMEAICIREQAELADEVDGADRRGFEIPRAVTATTRKASRRTLRRCRAAGSGVLVRIENSNTGAMRPVPGGARPRAVKYVRAGKRTSSSRASSLVNG